MNRFNEMESFIKYLASIAKNCSTNEFEKGLVYGELVRIGIFDSDKEVNVKNKYFDSWINEFKNIYNMNTYVSSKWPYFCQFVSMDFEGTNAIKLYVPLKESHLYNGANILFKFLSDNNITHRSKIGSEIRNDNVVIRVKSKEDAIKVSDFINSNSYLKEGLNKPNPFSITDGNIAYASDGIASYNSELAYYLKDYINIIKKNDKLDTATLNGFTNYLKNMYNQVFIDCDEDYINYYLKTHEYDSLQGNKLINYLTNNMEICRLTINAISENNISNVFENYNNLENIEYNNKLQEHLNKKIKSNEKPTTPLNKSSILATAVFATYNKYGYMQAKEAIELAAKKNSYSGFTRDNGARQMLEEHVSTSEIISMIANSLDGDYNICLYLNKILDMKSVEIKQDYIVKACELTYTKYGMKQMQGAIECAIENNFMSFTNTNNARENLIKNVSADEIKSLIEDMLKKENVDNEDSIVAFSSLIVNRINKEQMNKK